MLNRIATSLSKRLISDGVISENDLDIYVYGFELFFSFLFSLTMILITGCIVNKLFETLAFLIVFILLRSYSGGYHSDTYLKCTVITMSIYGMVMLFSTYLQVHFLLYFVLIILGWVVLYIKAPVENPNKKLTEQEKKKHRVTSLVLFTFFGLGGIFLNVFSEIIGATIWAALVVDLSLMFVKSHYERRIC